MQHCLSGYIFIKDPYRTEDDQEFSIDSDDLTRLPWLASVLESMPRCVKPASMKLEVLFGGLPHPPCLPRVVIDEEAALMEAFADAEEDERPDDGAIEVDSEEEYHKNF